MILLLFKPVKKGISKGIIPSFHDHFVFKTYFMLHVSFLSVALLSDMSCYGSKVSILYDNIFFEYLKPPSWFSFKIPSVFLWYVLGTTAFEKKYMLNK